MQNLLHLFSAVAKFSIVESFLKQLAKLLRFLVGIEELANVGAEQMVSN